MTTNKHERGARSGGLVLVLAAVGLAAMFLMISNMLGIFGFGEQTIDRSQPPLLISLTDLSEYRAATANFEVVVDIEKDTKFVPDFLKGTRTLMVAAGNVDAKVDFSQLKDENVIISDDRKSVRIILPAPTLAEVRIDNDNTYVADRQRGLADRIGGIFSNPADDQEMYQAAEAKLSNAAANSEILNLAETNTRAMLTALLTSLGFENISIEFEIPPNAP